jgi:hypothetical protein
MSHTHFSQFYFVKSDCSIDILMLKCVNLSLTHIDFFLGTFVGSHEVAGFQLQRLAHIDCFPYTFARSHEVAGSQ